MNPNQYNFKDVAIVDIRGNVEYVKMGDTDFFQVDQDMLQGTKVMQWYQNRSEETSTLMMAVNSGKESLNYEEYLMTHTGRVVRQYSDTLCIRDGEAIIGAVEFAWYDPKKDIVFEPEQKTEQDSESTPGIADYIGISERICTIKKRISRIADITTPVFITGKTGTGKEMLARIIHNCGSRSGGEFVYVNCGAIPENLMESILFGTARGSFTGSEDKDGLFQAADGGTLFLDELNSMPLSVQGKLLKAIEEKRIRRIGDDMDREVDVRIITSCNESIPQIIRKKSLRSDLFFRISSIQMELPDLKDRREDIPLLSHSFVEKFAKKYSKGQVTVSKNAMDILTSYDWPGNVRELRNVMESATYRIESPIIEGSDLRITLCSREPKSVEQEIWEQFISKEEDLRTYIKDLETELLQEALRRHPDDLTKASKELGISRQCLKQKLSRHTG